MMPPHDKITLEELKTGDLAGTRPRSLAEFQQILTAPADQKFSPCDTP
jgi:hypothetical protein